ncbi:Uncharacterised protein [Candidatus Venteria ishoeyi]|uniref:Uncharacterized protein n=1 Tax=Candidatus Venteria ishoeyi TaxID=1899563 RepID=A0A1H6F9Q3_9GAMM|nr:Uncharacterised protein [Candidatus Venteria ishoeyi]
MRAKTSRPSSSVPKKYIPNGGRSAIANWVEAVVIGALNLSTKRTVAGSNIWLHSVNALPANAVIDNKINKISPSIAR